MKVTFKNMIHGYTGKGDEIIYYMDKRTGRIYARSSFQFKNHPGQPPFRTAQRAIYAIKPSDGFKLNLYDYLLAYNTLPFYRERPLRNWCNAYSKLMWALHKAMPETVDLKTITRQQIYDQNLPCITVKAAIDAGLIPKVQEYQRFDKQI